MYTYVHMMNSASPATGAGTGLRKERAVGCHTAMGMRNNPQHQSPNPCRFLLVPVIEPFMNPQENNS